MLEFKAAAVDEPKDTAAQSAMDSAEIEGQGGLGVGVDIECHGLQVELATASAASSRSSCGTVVVDPVHGLGVFGAHLDRGSAFRRLGLRSSGGGLCRTEPERALLE